MKIIVYKNFNDKNRCIFIHIPKVAGISLEMALFEEKVGHKRIVEFLDEDEKKFNEYFKFAFVRNPYDRIASAYFFLKNGGRNKYDKAWAEARLSKINSFEEFVLKLDDEEFKKTIIGATHFIPQYKFITDNNDTILVDFIGSFETLQDDFNYICGKLGKDSKLHHINKTIGKKNYQELYTKKMQDIVYHVYKRDFELLNYSYGIHCKKKNIIFHIGYPKSASTTLQKHLFDKHDELFNLGLYPSNNIGNDTEDNNTDAVYLKDNNLKKFYDMLTLPESASFDDVEKFYRINIKSYLNNTEKKIVFSHERFTSVFFAEKDYKKKAEKLRYVLKDIKVLIIIRNQYDWLKSQYRDHPFDPRDFSKGNMISFDKWFEIICENNGSIQLLDILNYNEVIKFYEKTFGKENVGVFLFEDLVVVPHDFCCRVGEFMDIDSEKIKNNLLCKHENVGVGYLYNYYRSFKRSLKIKKIISKYKLNYLDNLIELFLKKSHKKDYKLSKKNEIFLKEYFEDSNLSLSKDNQLKMKNKGYFKNG